MIKIIASQNLKEQAQKRVQSCIEICDSEKNHPIAYFSTELSMNDFEEISNKKEAYLVHDFTEITDEGAYVNATISLPLASLLFVDFPDKSLFRTKEGFLDMEHIRKMIIPLKYKYNVKEIYIDNFHHVTCILMGRNVVWESKSIADIDFWKYRQMEYKLALLYHYSKKFELNFYIGMKLLVKEQQPKNIKHLTFGNSFDMIDGIEYC